MRKSIAAAAVAASLAAGTLAGAVLGVPVAAGATGSASGAVGWVQDALGGLVDAGTITQQQADAVETALEEARPARGPGHHGGPMHLATVAGALGTTEDELRTALRGGQTVAEVAAGKGVAVQTVIDAVVAEHEARLDDLVAAGDLTREEADQRLAGATERATAFVNGELPAFAGRGHRGPPPGAPAGAGTEATA